MQSEGEDPHLAAVLVFFRYSPRFFAEEETKRRRKKKRDEEDDTMTTTPPPKTARRFQTESMPNHHHRTLFVSSENISLSLLLSGAREVRS